MAKHTADPLTDRLRLGTRTSDLEARDTAMLRRARAALRDVAQCGCFSEAEGEGMDTEHRTSITIALRYLNTVLWTTGSDDE